MLIVIVNLKQTRVSYNKTNTFLCIVVMLLIITELDLFI